MISAEAPHVKTVVVEILTFQRKRLIISPQDWQGGGPTSPLKFTQKKARDLVNL